MGTEIFSQTARVDGIKKNNENRKSQFSKIPAYVWTQPTTHLFKVCIIGGVASLTDRWL